MLPLTYASPEAEHIIVKVNGNADVKKHLESLGFVSGTEVEVVSQASGTVIVSVKGARMGLNERTARHVYVR